jgi:hypothetical protein
MAFNESPGIKAETVKIEYASTLLLRSMLNIPLASGKTTEPADMTVNSGALQPCFPAYQHTEI